MPAILRAVAIGATAAVLMASAAEAATMTLACTEKSGGKDVPFTLAYEGDATGTLTFKSAAYEMKLTARYVEQDATNWGINGYGPANAIMPDKAGMEACLKGKASPGELDDADMLALFVAGCQTTVAPGAAPVAISANFEITAIDGDIMTFVTRKYTDPSPVAGEHIELASFPLPACTKQ